MFDDDSSYDEPFMSPPIEVKIQSFANFDNAEFTDDEKEDLMDDWNELHKATTAGVRMGMQEGFGDDDKIDFNAPMDGYHSDPEPAYYASEDNKRWTLAFNTFVRGTIGDSTSKLVLK